MKKLAFAVAAVMFATSSAAPVFAQSPATQLYAYANLQFNSAKGQTSVDQYSVSRKDDQLSWSDRKDGVPVVTEHSTVPRVETPMLHNETALGSAYADLRTGKVGVYAEAPRREGEALSSGNAFANAQARIAETLTFLVANATADSVTRIPFEIALHGALAGSGNWSVQGLFGPANGGGSSFYLGGAALNGAVSQSLKGDVAYQALSENEGVIRGSASFQGGRWTTGFDLSLFAQAYSIDVPGRDYGIADMRNTATIKFDLPANVTMTSASGQFLSKGGVGAVPEPATWLTMILGFGMIGAALRHRRQPVRISL